MTLAISHREIDGVAVLDCIREVRAPFQPEAVVDDFCKTLASYGVARVTGDRYGGEWPREQFSKRNITYRPSEKVKSDIYRDMLPILNSRRCQLLDIPRLMSQFHGLERRLLVVVRIRLIMVLVLMMIFLTLLRVRLCWLHIMCGN
jgi:hypothetical protein